MGEPLPLREPELPSLEGRLWALRGLGAARRGVPAFSATPSTAWPPVGAVSHALCLLLQFGLSLLLVVLSRGEDLQSSDAASESAQSNPWSVWAVFLL